MTLKTKYIQSGVDPVYVNVAGDTMTGFLTVASDPTQALHAVTKSYVDQVVANVGGVPQVSVVSSTTNLTNNNGIILANASNNIIVITLAAPTAGSLIRIKKTDSSLNAVTIAPNGIFNNPPSGRTIDGDVGIQLKYQYDSVTITTDGSNYYIV